MALNLASVTRFKARVDSVLEELFPVTLTIGSTSVTASGPGGRTFSEYLDGGESETYRFPFRVQKSKAPTGWSPIKGGQITWVVSPSQSITLEIISSNIRVWENAWEFSCRRKRI